MKKTPKGLLQRLKRDHKEVICTSDGLFVFCDTFDHQPEDGDDDDGVQIVSAHRVFAPTLDPG